MVVYEHGRIRTLYITLKNVLVRGLAEEGLNLMVFVCYLVEAHVGSYDGACILFY